MSSSRWGHQNHFKSAPEIWGIFRRTGCHVMKKRATEEKVRKKKNKSNFCKPGTTEPAKQNSIKMSLHVVNVSLQMKTYWIQVYTNRNEGFFLIEIEKKGLVCLYNCSIPLVSDGLLA